VGGYGPGNQLLRYEEGAYVWRGSITRKVILDRDSRRYQPILVADKPAMGTDAVRADQSIL
jgi:hypothetical protein